MTRRGRLRVVTFLLLVTAIAALAVWFEHAHGPTAWREVFSSRESVRAFVGQFDPYGPIAFFMLQLAAVIVAPMPGNVVALAGGALFGLWTGFLLSTGALIVGSSIAFGLARFYGRPLVERLVPKRIVDKYLDHVAQRHFALLFGTFLLPFFPDDALCFVSGLSSLRFLVFLALVIIGRPPGMFVANLIGAGLLVVPWWGWIVVAVGSGALLYVLYRMRGRIEAMIGSITVPDRPAE